jgi:hypothetical protein
MDGQTKVKMGKLLNQVFLFAAISVIMYSCQAYEQPKLLSLSGEYRIDKITYEKIDNASSADYQVFYPGNTFINSTERFPMDTIFVGFTTWAMDYAQVYMLPKRSVSGRTIWQKEYFYSILNQTVEDCGYLSFDCEGSRRIFKIIDDGLESLTLRSTGHWGYAQLGPNVSLTLYLTRVGP